MVYEIKNASGKVIAALKVKSFKVSGGNDTKLIRKELKGFLGHNARKVTVKGDYNKLVFTIRDKSVNKKELEVFANAYKNISYCSSTGEVLSGGNTFTYVNYSEAITKEINAIDVSHLKVSICNPQEVEYNGEYIYQSVVKEMIYTKTATA